MENWQKGAGRIDWGLKGGCGSNSLQGTESWPIELDLLRGKTMRIVERARRASDALSMGA